MPHFGQDLRLFLEWYVHLAAGSCFDAQQRARLRQHSRQTTRDGEPVLAQIGENTEAISAKSELRFEGLAPWIHRAQHDRSAGRYELLVADGICLEHGLATDRVRNLNEAQLRAHAIVKHQFYPALPASGHVATQLAAETEPAARVARLGRGRELDGRVLERW